MSHSLIQLSNALAVAGAHAVNQVRDLMKGAAAPVRLIGRAGSYAALNFSTATADPARGALLQKVQERGTQIETRLLFFDLEWAALEGADPADLASRYEVQRDLYALAAASRASSVETAYVFLERPDEPARTAFDPPGLDAARERIEALLARLVRVRAPTVNGTAWKLLALAQAGRPLARGSVRFLLAHQAKSGGWSWAVGGAPDSNDTAAVVEALRAARVKGRPITRALVYLRRLQNMDGGFELTPGRGSDAQSTGWAIQAFLAAGARPGHAAYAYLARLRRPDGSYRYSAKYVTTPVWVTAQVLPALAGRPFPLR